jgi:hemolysin D
MSETPNLPATRSDKALDSTRREFLPAAMELERTPASPLGRAILWSIMALFVLAVAWACIGKVDVVAVAQGSLVPSGHTKVIQPTDLGRIAAIHVRNGDRVQVGQPLITLDGTQTRAEVRRLEESVRARGAKIRRLAAFVSEVRALYAAPAADDARPMRAASKSTGDALLAMQLQTLRATDQTLLQQRLARESELAQAKERVKSLTRTLPLLTERTDAIRQLHERDLAPKIQRLELEQSLIEAESQLQAERHRLEQLRAEIAEIERRRQQLRFETLRDALAQKERRTVERNELRQELIKARALNRRQILTAPIAGTVHNVRVHTVGGVVQPAQPLMEIVPASEHVIVEAWVLNRDIGFVQVGQSVSVKINTFQFTKYGAVPGEIVHLSSDAVIDEQAGPRYLARIQLQRHWMDIGDKRMALVPGMTVSAEIATGHRRIIEFVAAPILSALAQAGRER